MFFYLTKLYPPKLTILSLDFRNQTAAAIHITMFQMIWAGITSEALALPTYRDRKAPPRLPKGWYWNHLSMPKGSIRKGITVPEKKDTTALLMT